MHVHTYAGTCGCLRLWSLLGDNEADPHQHKLLDRTEIRHGRPGLHVLHHLLFIQQFVRAGLREVLIGTAPKQLLGGRGQHQGEDVIRVRWLTERHVERETCWQDYGMEMYLPAFASCCPGFSKSWYVRSSCLTISLICLFVSQSKGERHNLQQLCHHSKLDLSSSWFLTRKSPASSYLLYIPACFFIDKG